MEDPLERPHAVFQVHLEQSLLDHCGGVMEGEQIGISVGVTRGLLEDPVAVEAGDDLDGLGQKPGCTGG